MKKVNQRGVAHLVLVGGFIAVFAIAGVAYMVATSAQTPPTAKAASNVYSVHIKTASIKGAKWIEGDKWQNTHSSKASLYVSLTDQGTAANQKGKCEGQEIGRGTLANFGSKRTIRCELPVGGGLKFSLQGAKTVETKGKVYQDTRVVTHGRSKQTIYLGTSQ